MKSFLIILLVAICLNSYSKNRKVLTLDDYPSNNHISFEFAFGAGRSFTEVYTGFGVDNGSIATFFPSSGGLLKFSTNFFNDSRWSCGLSYAYQLGGLNNLYENGDGSNDRTILTPTIRFAPFLIKKGKVNIGAGLNAVLSNTLEIEAKLPKEEQFVKYEFKKAYGPTFLIEYQENFNDWAGGRVGLSYNYLRYELSSMKYNNLDLILESAPYEMINHSAVSLDLYIAFYVFL
jgi:hypothetical protein